MTTVAIFGISGRTGQALTSDARARGWAVRSFGRISSVAPMGASMIHGAFTEPGRVQEVVQGADAVCCVFGPRSPHTEVFCAEATRAVITAMQATRCRRLLCVTGAMVGEARSRSRTLSWMAAAFRWRQPATARDRAEQEAAVAGSTLDWTIIKPPRLTDAGPTGRVAAAPDLPVGLLSSISRPDLAHYMLDAVGDRTLIHQRVIVKNRS